MSVGLKQSLFALVAMLALSVAPCESHAQLYEGSNGWFAGGPIGYTAYRPLAVPTTAYYGGCNTCATPVAVTAYRPGPFAWFRGWFQRPVTVVGYAPSCCGTGIAAPALAAPACSTCAAPSLASYAPAASCCGGSAVTAAYAPATTTYASPAPGCCGGGAASTAYYPQAAPTTTYYQAPPATVTSPASPPPTYPVSPTPAPNGAAPATTQDPASVYTPQSNSAAAAPNGAESTEDGGSTKAEPKTFKKEESTAPQFNAPLKPVPQGKTNIKGGLFQGPTLVDPEDRTTLRPTGHFAVKQAVLVQPAKASAVRPSNDGPLDTEGWRPARAR